MSDTRLRKIERLSQEKHIELLFTKGSTAYMAYPLRAVFRKTEPRAFPVEIVISVAKKRLRHAVDRNRAKRQIREAYRLHKSLLLEKLANNASSAAPPPFGVSIAFLWLSDVPQQSALIHACMSDLLAKIADRI